MRQRAMIAMALACKPDLLIADEPTTALDVTVQAQILDLIQELMAENSVLLITHDLGVVAEVTDYVAVMYAGKVVEYGTTREIFNDPKHPYTQALLSSLPVRGRKILRTIEGVVPDLAKLPSYCSFYPRCLEKGPLCKEGVPPIEGEGHMVRCFKRR